MLNRIVYAIDVRAQSIPCSLCSSNEYLDEWKQPKDPSEMETVIPWDCYWDDILAVEAAAVAAAPLCS
jgi:hypothetical protein